jgi:hypothetical protein
VPEAISNTEFIEGYFVIPLASQERVGRGRFANLDPPLKEEKRNKPMF